LITIPTIRTFCQLVSPKPVSHPLNLLLSLSPVCSSRAALHSTNSTHPFELYRVAHCSGHTHGPAPGLVIVDWHRARTNPYDKAQSHDCLAYHPHLPLSVRIASREPKRGGSPGSRFLGSRRRTFGKIDGHQSPESEGKLLPWSTARTSALCLLRCLPCTTWSTGRPALEAIGSLTLRLLCATAAAARSTCYADGTTAVRVGRCFASRARPGRQRLRRESAISAVQRSSFALSIAVQRSSFALSIAVQRSSVAVKRRSVAVQKKRVAVQRRSVAV